MTPGLARRGAAAVRRIGAIAARHPLTVIELIAWRIALPPLKRIVPVSKLAVFMWTPAPAFATGVPDARTQETLRLIANAGRVFLSSNCLERSLVIYRLLSRTGASPQLILGTRIRDGVLSGHAWIELDHQPLGESDAGSYTPLTAFGGHGAPEPVCPARGAA